MDRAPFMEVCRLESLAPRKPELSSRQASQGGAMGVRAPPGIPYAATRKGLPMTF